MRRFWIHLGLWLLVCAPLRADSRLLFPRILFQQARFSGIAIANPTATEAKITLKAYRADGSLFAGAGVVNPREVTIPAGQQYAKLCSEIFTPPPDVAGGATPTRLWMEVTSTTDGLTGFFLDGNNNLDFLDGADLSGSGNNLVLPLVENSGPSSTEISLVNPGSTVADIVIEFVRSDGTLADRKTASLAARAALQGPLSTLFSISYADVVALRVRSDRPLVCYGYISRQNDSALVTVAAQSASTPARTIFFPQLAEGDGWATSVGVVNFSNVAELLTITAYKPDGTLFVAPAVRENPVSRNIAAGGIFRSDLRSLFGFAASPLRDGWIKVEARAASINGFVEYGAGGNRALVAAQLDSYPRAIFSHQAQVAPYFTGLAVLNIANLAANVEVVSLGPDGKVHGKAQRVLKPGQRESLLIDQWIPSAAGKAGGSVFVKSDSPVVATQLFGTGNLTVLANVPPQKVTTPFDPGASLPSLRIAPNLAVVETGKSQRFDSGSASGVSWRVNDVPGGNSTLGTVSPSGLYTAPRVTPLTHTVTLQASAEDGARSGGASINIVQRETLTAGLTQVTAVAYLENLQRFFVAEQQLLSSVVSEEGTRRATTATSKISEQSPGGALSAFFQIPNETIGKMLPYVDGRGGSHLIIAGTDGGKVYRLGLADKQLVTVASGLNKPSSLALDPDNKNLLVAEEDKISILARSQYDPTATSYVGQNPARPRRSVPVPGAAQGIGFDDCGGKVFVTTADGRLLEFAGKNVRTVLSGLDRPSEILVLYLEGEETCEDALFLLVCEANRVIAVLPGINFAFEFIPDTAGALDLGFFPEKSPFIRDGDVAFAVGEGPPGVGNSRVSDVLIGSLFDDDEPEEEGDEGGLPFHDPEGDTFETPATGARKLQVFDIVSVDAIRWFDSVIFSISFADVVTPYDNMTLEGLVGLILFDFRPSGAPSLFDEFNPFGGSDVGVDAILNLTDGTLADLVSLTLTPIEVYFLDDEILFEIPVSVVDLTKAAATILVGNDEEPTDIAPDDGFIGWDLGALAGISNEPTGTAAPASTIQSTKRRSGREWLQKLLAAPIVRN